MDDDTKRAYLEGFAAKCDEYGVDPEAVAEMAAGRNSQPVAPVKTAGVVRPVQATAQTASK